MAEKVTPQKQAEEHNFLDAVMATRPMQYVHSYLAQKVTLSALLCLAPCARFPLRRHTGAVSLREQHTSLVQHWG